MKTQLLGQSGLRVSQLCLGTMTFGEDWQWGANREISRQIFDKFAEAGGNFLDTANAYTDGTSEKFVGELIAPDRDAWVVATKYTLPDSMGLTGEAGAAPHVSKTGNSRKNMMRSVEGSLKRLGTDHIDLLYLHIWDFTTHPEEVMRSLDDLVRQGKVLYAGISDTPAWIVSHAQTLALLRGWTPFSVLQIEYSLAERTVERDLIPMAHALGLTVAPWSPLAGGVLSGKYSQGDTASNRGFPISPKSLEIAAKLGEVAREIGCSSSQLALKWLVDKNTLPILGARKLDQFEDNLKCLEVTISPEQMAQLDKISAIELGFPHDFITGEFVQPRILGGKKELLDGGMRG